MQEKEVVAYAFGILGPAASLGGSWARLAGAGLGSARASRRRPMPTLLRPSGALACLVAPTGTHWPSSSSEALA